MLDPLTVERRVKDTRACRQCVRCVYTAPVSAGLTLLGTGAESLTPDQQSSERLSVTGPERSLAVRLGRFRAFRECGTVLLSIVSNCWFTEVRG